MLKPAIVEVGKKYKITQELKRAFFDKQQEERVLSGQRTAVFSRQEYPVKEGTEVQIENIDDENRALALILSGDYAGYLFSSSPRTQIFMEEIR